MAQPSLRLAFQAARPLWHAQNPESFIRTCRYSTSFHRPASISQQTSLRSISPQQTLRPISTTASRSATVVLKNPRIDEDGQDMTIKISDKAAKRLRQITTSTPPKNTLVQTTPSSDSHLRVTVTSGGCHGFQYLMSLEPTSKIDEEEDTVFAVQDDAADSKGKAQVVMDLASLELLKGSTVDFTQELIGSQFKITGNPRASSSCGCGTSFDIQ